MANKSQILKFELLIFHPILLQFLAKLLSLWVIDEPEFFFFLLFYIRNFAYLEGMFSTWNSKTRQMSNIQWIQHMTVSSTVLCPVGPSWSYGSWIYNYSCTYNQCLSQLTMKLRIRLRRGELNTTLCDKVCQWLAAGLWFSPGTPVSSTNKTDHHDITEILLKAKYIYSVNTCL